MSKFPRVAGVNYESVVDGEGVRAVIYFAGCLHNCPECQNADIQDPNAGQECTEELIKEIADEINKRPFLRGITLSGGDPFYRPEKTLQFLISLTGYLGDKLKIGTPDQFDLWIYTGYTWEQIVNQAEFNRDLTIIIMLDCLSVIVDGEFISSQADKRLKFRGSRNQRLINVRKSRNKSPDHPVIWRGRNEK